MTRKRNGNTVTVQADKQKASVSGYDNSLEQEVKPSHVPSGLQPV